MKEWLAANKSWLAPLLFLAGAGSLIAAWHCHPVPESAISTITFDAQYVGALKGVLSARGIGGGEIGLGYGREEDIGKMRAAGAPCQLGMLDQDIVTVSGAGGGVISYEHYAARYRDLLLLALAMATILARRTDANGSSQQ